MGVFGSWPLWTGSLGVRCRKMEEEEILTISLSAQVPFVRVRFRVFQSPGGVRTEVVFVGTKRGAHDFTNGRV